MKLKQLAVALSLIAMIVTGAWAVDKRYAQEDELQIVASNIQNLRKRYEMDSIEQRMYDLRRRWWLLDDRYMGQQMPVSIREEIAGIKGEIEHLRLKMERLNGRR